MMEFHLVLQNNFITNLYNQKARHATSLFNMGRMKRFELSTSGTTNQRSNQLSYIRHCDNEIVNTVKPVKSQY